MPKATKKSALASQFEIVVVGELSPYALLTARLIVMGLSPVEARRRVDALKLKREAEAAEAQGTAAA